VRSLSCPNYSKDSSSDLILANFKFRSSKNFEQMLLTGFADFCICFWVSFWFGASVGCMLSLKK
jgi:hypothetical protein